MTPPRYVCIHGHFYQPPRENPWLEAIEHQASARPYHDWNERITAECYAPNAAARIMDDRGRVADLISTYERISYNVGPTLLSWMEKAAPAVYASLVEADADGRERLGGGGPAMAQAYNHIILPLANDRDRETQVKWGVRDFQRRYGREPEGMWLPETAVDTPSLEALAAEGIRFTVLAPNQAAAVRPPGGPWRDVGTDDVDTTRPYRVALPSGREITVFFYHGRLSQDVAFDGVLRDGAEFARRLVHEARNAASEAPLVHLATDGETYGHHHRHGEMALAYALRSIERSDDVELVTYGAYLDRHPATWEARIREDTSWSCAHGVERWRSDCGCRLGRGPGWVQTWREPLREALDWLRDALEPRFEEAAGELFPDPWDARNRYIDVILDRSDTSIDGFFRETAGRPLEDEERTQGLRLMELQRNLLLMYTSCGWFFDEISDIETVQVLRYAGRVIHLANELLGPDTGAELERELEYRLRAAPSNKPEFVDGAEVYRRTVEEARIDLSKAAAHYAVSSVFDHHADHSRIYCYRYDREDESRLESGSATLLVGRVRVTSEITRNAKRVTYAVLHLGNQNLAGGVRPMRNGEAYDSLQSELETAFHHSELTTVLRILDREFEASTYSLRSLFRDAQLRIVDTLLEGAIEEAEELYTQVYEEHGALLRFLADLRVPAPEPFALAAEHVLNERIRRMLEEADLRLPALRMALEAATTSGVHLDREKVGFAAQDALERLVRRLEVSPADEDPLHRVRELVQLFRLADVPLDLWKVQNQFWRYGQAVAGTGADGPGAPGAEETLRQEWLAELRAVADVLKVEIPI